MSIKPHVPTLDELREKLTVTFDPKEYDELQAAIQQAEKAAHLTKARSEVDRRAQAEAERQAKLAKHESDRKALAAKPAEMLALDAKIFKTLAKLHDLLEERHTLTQATRALFVEAKGEAEALEQPTVPTPVDPNDWPDQYNLEAFAKSWMQRYIENHRQAKITGIELTLDHMPLTTVRIASIKPAKTEKG